MLDNIAKKANIPKWDPETNAIEKLRKILSVLEMVSVGMPDPKGELPSLEMAIWARKAATKAYDLFRSKQTISKNFRQLKDCMNFCTDMRTNYLAKQKADPTKQLFDWEIVFQLRNTFQSTKPTKKRQ